jgi:type IV pilus assembly protein PilQ
MKSYWAGKAFLLIFLMLFINCCSNALVQTPKQDIQVPIVQTSVVKNLSFAEEEHHTRIHMEGSGTLSQPFYKVVEDPLKVIIDIPNIDVRQIREPIKINNGTIREVSATQYDDKGRIEIGLAQRANYNISKEDKDLIIDFEKVKRVPENQEVNQEAKQEVTLEVKKEENEGKGEESAPPSVITEKDEPLPIPQTPPAAPETVAKAKEIIDLLLEEKNDSITFNIIADGRLGNYNGFKLDAPSRFVLDIWGVNSRYPKKSIKTKNPLIKEVRIGQHPDRLRLVFDPLKLQLPPYQVNRIDNRIIVSFGNVPQPPGPEILVQGKSTEGTAPAQRAKPAVLREINFIQLDGKSRVLIALSEEPQFESRMISNKVIAVEIKNASVPKRLQRGLNTTEFESAVDMIDLENVKTGKTNDVRVLIRLREEVPFETTREGKVLFVDIEKPKKIEVQAAPVAVKEMTKEEVKKEEVKDEVKIETRAESRPEAKQEPKAEPKPEPSAEEKKEQEKTSPELKEAAETKTATKAEEEKKASEERTPEKIYSGKKVSLDFKDADIKNILRLIAEVSDLNIITSDDVTGKITMRLVDVPWDQALEIILQAKALGMTRIGNVVRVAPLEALKKEIQAELEAKRAKEKLEDLVLELIPVNYATGKEIIPQIKGVLSDRGDIRVDERTNTLIVKDIPRNIASMKSLIKSLDTKTPQVLIEARIVEANLTFQKELGVKWGFEVGGGTTTLGGGIPGKTLDQTTREVVDLPAVARAGVPGATGAAGLIEFLFSRGTIKQLDIAISAHENKGDARIISSPKIATIDNKEASVEQGLRVPYRKLTTEGTVTTDFIDANIKLTVTPHVTNDGHIKMSIKAKKDAPDYAITVDGVPRIDKKEAVTEVLVKDNGVIVIAGVYSIEKNEGNEGIPLFNKIPLLGWLFKREVKEDSRKDLLIFISPKIIKDGV